MTLLERLQSYADLKPGWDGYHALPPPQWALNVAAKVLFMACEPGFSIPSTVTPSVMTGVGFVWESASKNMHRAEMLIEEDSDRDLTLLLSEGPGKDEDEILYFLMDDTGIREALTAIRQHLEGAQ